MNEGKYLVSRVLHENLLITQFKRMARLRISELISSVGFDGMPAILYVLSSDGKQTVTESARIPVDFVDRVIYGYEESVIAFIYTHKIIVYDMPPEEFTGLLDAGVDLTDMPNAEGKVLMYYEDNLLKKTYYHKISRNHHDYTDVMDIEPEKTNVSESHPAGLNLSGLYSIN